MRTTINGSLIDRLLLSGVAVRQIVYYFDVWGNDKDGYEINNLCKEPIFILGDSYTNADLIKSLRRVGFLAPRVHFNVLEFMSGEEIYAGQYPVCRTEFDHTGWLAESLADSALYGFLSRRYAGVNSPAVVLLGGDVAGFDPMIIGGSDV